MTANSNNDPFASASNVQDGPFAMWGQMDIRAEYVVLQKGVGKVPFDPQSHSADERVTHIDMIFTPLAETKLKHPTQREVIAESRDWKKIVWPSARALGVTYAGDLNGAYCKVTMVKTGRTWTNKQGETKEGTAFQFDKIFPNEQACVADYYATLGTVQSEDNPFTDASAGVSPVNGPVRPPTNGNGSAPQANGNGFNPNERATAMMFLTALAAQHKGNPAGLQAAIAGTPLISKYFTVNSPEVQALLAA